jgi:triosephosphate isomerase
MAKKNSRKSGQKVVIGNWKMNPLTSAEAKRIIASVKKSAKKLTRTKVVMCPPFPFIGYALPKQPVKSGAKEVLSVGAQDAFYEDQGSFTGEVSARQLADMGLRYVIVGHSERRRTGDTAFAAETDAVVAKKANAVALAGMTAVVCVGELTRDSHGEYLEFLKNQIRASLQGFSKKFISDGLLMIAYEPVWAIGAKEAMTPTLIHEMTIFVKKVLADAYGQEEAFDVPILYGGSVNFRNAADIIRAGEVNGLLVGRESVNAPGFAELLTAVDQVK